VVLILDVFKVIFERRSVRKFEKKDIDDKLIFEILKAGLWAPSAGNLQSWDVILIKNTEKKRIITKAAYMRDFIGEAPVIIVLCANMHRSATIYHERGQKLFCIQDAACAGQNILLAAHAMGLGACWVGAFDEELLIKNLKLPDYLRPVTIIPIGYPDENPLPPPRREIEEVINWEYFQGI
jgi:nitroreductase